MVEFYISEKKNLFNLVEIFLKTLLQYKEIIFQDNWTSVFQKNYVNIFSNNFLSLYFHLTGPAIRNRVFKKKLGGIFWKTILSRKKNSKQIYHSNQATTSSNPGGLLTDWFVRNLTTLHHVPILYLLISYTYNIRVPTKLYGYGYDSAGLR